MRMEKGEPPSDDIEKEWLRKIRDEARKQQESDAARMVSAPFHAKNKSKRSQKKDAKKKRFLSKGQWAYGPTYCLLIDTHIRSKRYTQK